MQHPWPEQHIDTLRILLADPRKLSANDIALELAVNHRFTVSRCGVIGKVHRLGLTLPLAPTAKLPPEEKARRERVRQARSRTKAKTSGTPKRRNGFAMPAMTPAWDAGNPAARIVRAAELRESAVPVPVHVDDTAIPVGQRRTLLELNEETCRWPVGDPKSESFYFCGDRAEQGRPYCCAHMRRAYEPVAA